LCITCSAVVFTATAVVIYSSAFWLGRNDGIMRQLVDAMILFGSYPDRLFDGGLRLLLFTLIPAGFVSFTPARLLFAASPSEAALLALATLGYALAAFWTFDRGLARYSSGSRFGTFG
jgi:ABC-2 type transport system permease protein